MGKPRSISEVKQVYSENAATVENTKQALGPWPLALGPWPLALGPWPLALGPYEVTKSP